MTTTLIELRQNTVSRPWVIASERIVKWRDQWASGQEY